MIQIASAFSAFFSRNLDADRDAATRRIVASHSRGNAMLWMGRYLNDGDMADLQKRGDAAAARLSRRMRRAGAAWWKRPWIA